MKNNDVTVSTKTALEYAFVAYRLNKGYIPKNDLRVADDTSNTKIVYNCILSHLGYNVYNFKLPEVTDIDRQQLEKVDLFLKKKMFDIIGDSMNQFAKDMFSAIANDHIHLSKIGLISYFPKFFEKESKDWNFEKKLKTEYKNSTVNPCETVSHVMEVLSVRTIKNEFGEKQLVYAGCNGNVYKFYSKKIPEGSEGKTFHIYGRKKSCGTFYKTKIKYTVLNYVKVGYDTKDKS